MADDQRQPLLSSSPSAPLFADFRALPASVEKEGKLSEWAQDEYVRNSLRKLVAVEATTAVSGDEIRAAASTDPYPVWIYGALITPEEPEAAPGGVHGEVLS